MLVRIVRESVRRNPRAGTTTYIPGRPTRLWTSTYLLQNALGDVFGLEIETCDESGSSRVTLNVQPVSQPTATLCDVSSSFCITQNMFPLYEAPQTWFFDYEDPEIYCQECGHCCRLSELDDEFTEDDDYGYSERRYICPCCREADVVSGGVEYESLADVLKELELIKSV